MDSPPATQFRFCHCPWIWIEPRPLPHPRDARYRVVLPVQVTEDRMAGLTQQQTDTLEQTLRSRRDALRNELEQSLRREGHSDLAENLDRVHDGGDDALADVRADVNVAHLVAQYDELRDLDGALQRLGSGEFGDCVDCGEAIPFERLQSMPTATRCVACQEKHEQRANRGRTDSTPSL